MCEMLNMLEGYPLKQLGFRSAQAVHIMIEAMRHAYQDRNTSLGDPDFVAQSARPPASTSSTPRHPRQHRPINATPSCKLRQGRAARGSSNTTHYSIVDRYGNAVSVTYTLNDWFGASVIARRHRRAANDEMDDFTAKPGAPNMYGLVQGDANAIAPGKRPL